MKKMFLLLLMVSVAFAQCPPPSEDCINNITNIILCEQGGLIALVFMFMTIFVALAYMVGRFLNYPQFTVWASEEIYHLLFSAVLLVSFGGVLAFSCTMMDSFFSIAMENIGPGYCYTHGQPLAGVSSCYLSIMKSDGERVAQKYINAYIQNNLESTFSASVAIPLLDTYTLTAGAYRIIHSNQYNFIVNSFLLPALLSINMQKVFLDLISENVIVWLLPSAFVLRIFAPTRQFGNILFALAVGLYIIMPFIYTFNLAMYDVVEGECNDGPTVAGPSVAKAVCDTVADRNCSAPSSACDNPKGFWFVAKLIPQAFFLPNLTIAIIIVFVSSIDKALRVMG